MKATDLPQLRNDVLKYLGSDLAKQHWIRTGAQYGFAGRMPSDPVAAGGEIIHDEQTRWRMAELFYVTEDMTDLAVAAGRTLPSFHLRPSDLPSEFGLIYFAKPFDHQMIAGGDGKRTHVVACTWGPKTHPDGTRSVWMSFWADQRFTAAQALERGEWTQEYVDRYFDLAPDIGYDDEGMWRFDAPDDGQPLYAMTGVGAMMAAVRAAWLLMAQQIASVHRVQPRKSELRALRRKKLDLNAVRIVSLRHRKSEHNGDGTDRQYTRRWIVRGHWRNQWYPSQNRHIPLWINAHVKGPDNAPMLTGEVVNAWSR